MADFVAVLKKTLDGLSDPSPDTRQRVYARARQTVLSRLEAINPPPPKTVADKQLKALEDAISTVEGGYAAQPKKRLDPLDELEDVFASLNGLKDQPTIPVRPAIPQAPPPRPVTFESRTSAPASEPRPSTIQPPQRPVAPPQAPQRLASAPTPAPTSARPALAPPATAAVNPRGADASPAVQEPPRERSPQQSSRLIERKQPARMPPAADDELVFDEDVDAAPDAPKKRRGFGGAIAALVALALIGGGAYGVWTNKDEFSRMVGLQNAEPVEPAKPAPAAEQPKAAEAKAPEQPVTPEVAEPAPAAPQKITQRLNEDGTEADPGPAQGEASVGEGTTVAAVTPGVIPPPVETLPAAPAAETPPPPVESPAAEAPAAETPPVDPTPATAEASPSDASSAPEAPAAAAEAPPVEEAPVAEPAQTAAAPAAEQPAAVAVGQKAIFYEERTSSAEGSAEPGSTVWSVVQESPGANQPAEPAIRAVATVPGKDLELRMTIRRNADTTLPASHIVEMIFLTPDGSTEGPVDNILRMALKGSEQEAGSPIIGLPAKIGDGFFLVALNDSKAEIDANMNLLQKQNWIDIAVVYKSGRRALITMEKGIPGEKVFADVLKTWGVASSG